MNEGISSLILSLKVRIFHHDISYVVIFVSKFGICISKFGTCISKFGMDIPKFEMEKCRFDTSPSKRKKRSKKKKIWFFSEGLRPDPESQANR